MPPRLARTCISARTVSSDGDVWSWNARISFRIQSFLRKQWFHLIVSDLLLRTSDEKRCSSSSCLWWITSCVRGRLSGNCERTDDRRDTIIFIRILNRLFRSEGCVYCSDIRYFIFGYWSVSKRENERWVGKLYSIILQQTNKCEKEAAIWFDWLIFQLRRLKSNHRHVHDQDSFDFDVGTPKGGRLRISSTASSRRTVRGSSVGMPKSRWLQTWANVNCWGG